jgi:hypothetical protein
MGNVHLLGIDPRNLLARLISSSQLISRRVATAWLGRVLHLAAFALLFMEIREVGNGRGILGLVGR